MNLQICVPYEPCVYNCPMCISRGHKHENKFDNLYKNNYKLWQRNLVETTEYYDDLIITGECDPTQNSAFVNDVVRTIYDTRYGTMPNIEIITHNQKYANCFRNLRHIGTIALSVTNAREYLSSWQAEKPNYIAEHYRLVILLTKEFEFLNADNFNTMGFDQVTFKTLQYGENGDVNRWICDNKMSDESLDRIREIVEKYNSSDRYSVRLDTSCMDSDGRYEIFRSDGNVYHDWNEFPFKE